MIKFILFLALFGFFSFFIIVVLFGRVIRFFGGGSQKPKAKQRKANNKSQYAQSTNTTPKKFSKNEGEYVDYEEIKDK